MVSVYRRMPVDPRELFTGEEIATAERYRRPLRRAALAESAAGALGLAAAVVLRLAGRMVRALSIGPPAEQVTAIAAALVVSAMVLDLPFSAWRRAYERRWGFSRQGLADWAADRAKSLVVALALGAGVALGLWAIARATASWWLWAWVSLTALSVLLGMVAPAVLAPLFNRFRPLQDEAISGAALELGRRIGVPIREVLVMDASRRTAKHNAYVTGIGRTRRVVLWDTLLADCEAPATIAVLAHELGHWRRHHVQWLLGLSSAALLPGLFGLHLALGWEALHRWAAITGPADPRALPVALLAATAGQVLWLPAAGWVSRAFERQADADAVALIPDPAPFVAMMRDLARRNLSDLDPSPVAYLLASHPPAPERMARAMRPRAAIHRAGA